MNKEEACIVEKTSGYDVFDWERCRVLSLEPGGFRDARTRLWPKVLHVSAVTSNKSEAGMSESEVVQSLGTSSVHRDERQIGLDTDRSFVLYPVEEKDAERERRQHELHDLIVSIFRQRQRLNYFQGYHDVVSVLFLTLPRELQAPCMEKMSLHRLRDSMGASLEPVVGLLRVLKNLLRIADPSFAEILERTMPLPYFALSNILTLFSHDVPTLPLIQHFFDYLLCRHPIAVVYLVAAVTLSRKDEVMVLEKESEEGMIHSVLSSLPNLYEEDENAIPTEEDDDAADVVAPSEGKAEADAEVAEQVLTEIAQTKVESQPASDDETTPESSAEPSEIADDTTVVDSVDEQSETLLDEQLEIPVKFALVSQATVPEDDTPPSSVSDEGSPPSRSSRHEDVQPSLFETSPPSPSPVRTASPTPSFSTPSRPRVSLTSLFHLADALYARYPPSHPAIALSSIMGPQSVMHTWSEDPTELPSDKEAEAMVAHPELVVLPHIEPEVTSSEDEKVGRRERHKKLRKPRALDRVIERKTIVAGAVLVLGVAVMVYGIQAGYPPIFREGHRSRNPVGREFRRVSQVVGGVVLGLGERVFGGILQ